MVIRFAGDAMLDLGPLEYSLQASAAVNRNNLRIRLVMSAVSGVAVAFPGCLRGIRCGRSAAE